MYINFWYPACTSEELGDEPLPVNLFGLRFVAFRDTSGAAHLLSDTCIHRGGSLSRGKIIGDYVACPYHGWEYDGSGACTNIPSQKDNKAPARAKVDSYPVEECYGIVFAFMGDLPEEERPQLFAVEEWDRDGWRASPPTYMDINCYYERSVENGLDPVHNEFVHPLQGLPKMREDTLTVEKLPFGTSFMAHYGEINPKETNMDELRSNPEELRAGSLYHGPNTLITRICFSATNEFVQYGFEAPMGESLTRVYLVNMRNCMLEPEMDDRVRDVNRSVALEDIAILENLWPVRTPDTNTKEILMPGDEFVVRYREHLKEWDERGWRIDMQKLRENEGDVAYAVPCPARRESGNWVLDPVPTVSPAN